MFIETVEIIVKSSFIFIANFKKIHTDKLYFINTLLALSIITVIYYYYYIAIRPLIKYSIIGEKL